MKKMQIIHIGDGKFHYRSISCDGRGNLYVACDNVKVASFSNIDYTYSMAGDSDLKGAGFRSNCIEDVDNVGLSGNNEVYLDSFKLTAEKVIGFATHVNDKDETDAGKAANGILTFTPNGPDWQTSTNWAEPVGLYDIFFTHSRHVETIIMMTNSSSKGK